MKHDENIVMDELCAYNIILFNRQFQRLILKSIIFTSYAFGGYGDAYFLI